jgi:hypothetical protein
MADGAGREPENGCGVAEESAGDRTSRRRCRDPGGDGDSEFPPEITSPAPAPDSAAMAG